MCIEALAENATWEDVLSQVQVWKAIEEGIEDADEGRLVDTTTVRTELGLPV